MSDSLYSLLFACGVKDKAILHRNSKGHLTSLRSLCVSRLTHQERSDATRSKRRYDAYTHN